MSISFFSISLKLYTLFKDCKNGGENPSRIEYTHPAAPPENQLFFQWWPKETYYIVLRHFLALFCKKKMGTLSLYIFLAGVGEAQSYIMVSFQIFSLYCCEEINSSSLN